MDAAPRPALPFERAAETALLVALCALAAAAIFAGGGSTDDALASVGIAAVFAAAVALGAGLSGAVTLPRLDGAARVAVLASAALTAWAGLSIVWSIAGDLSWQWLARGLVYLAFLALGVLAGAAARGLRGVAAVLALVLALALGWALLGVAVPSLFPDGDRIARLREPVGYWNALALLAGAAVAFGLWAARRPGPARRVGGSLLVYAAVVALFLTQSRAGVLGAAVRTRALARALRRATRRTRSAPPSQRSLRLSSSAGPSPVLRSSRTAPSAPTGSTTDGSSPSCSSSAPLSWSRPRGGRRSRVSSPTIAGRCWWS